MTMDVNPVNVLLAVLFGAGVFALVAALFYERPVKLLEIEKIYGRGEAKLTVMQRVQRQLDDARFSISAGEFLRVSAVLAVLGGLLMYFLSGALLAGLIGLVMGGLSYWTYLSNKAARALEAYEDALPQVVSRLITGAKLGTTLGLAAEHVARFGPLNSRDDWAYIAAQLKSGAGVEQVLRVVSEKRGSQVLNSIFELLLVQQQRGIGMSDILPVIQESLEERVRTIRKARTKMLGPIRELWIVCAAPFVAVVLMRVMSPQFAGIYSTLPGQFLLAVGWGIDLAAFSIAYRSFSEAMRKETRFIGQLKAAPRAALSPQKGGAPKSSATGGAPSALASVTASSSPPAQSRTRAGGNTSLDITSFLKPASQSLGDESHE